MKIKLFAICSCLILAGQALAQNPLIDRNGKAQFFSEAPLEDIEATNEKVLGAIDLDKGSLAVSMYMKDFHFERSLMEEHFNENYIESDKFPKATFSGKLSNFSTLDFSEDGSFKTSATGEITIHGVTKKLNASVDFVVSGSSISATTKFDLSVAEFDVEIPKLVIRNIAEVVEVTATFDFLRE